MISALDRSTVSPPICSTPRISRQEAAAARSTPTAAIAAWPGFLASAENAPDWSETSVGPGPCARTRAWSLPSRTGRFQMTPAGAVGLERETLGKDAGASGERQPGQVLDRLVGMREEEGLGPLEGDQPGERRDVASRRVVGEQRMIDDAHRLEIAAPPLRSPVPATPLPRRTAVAFSPESAASCWAAATVSQAMR